MKRLMPSRWAMTHTVTVIPTCSDAKAAIVWTACVAKGSWSTSARSAAIVT
jgi:hypothetical protein